MTNYTNEILLHTQEIIKLEKSIYLLRANFDKNKNLFLSDEINKKVLNYEVSQLEEEIYLHQFCIHSLENNTNIKEVKEHIFTSAIKKNMRKLAKKEKFQVMKEEVVEKAIEAFDYDSFIIVPEGEKSLQCSFAF